MRTKGDTAGHEIAKGNSRQKQYLDAEKALSTAKAQEAQKKGRYVWSQLHRAYLLTTNSN